MGSVTNEVIRWNPFSEGYFDNPYPHLSACRELNPVQQGRHGEWILFRHDHVKAALRSDDFYTTDLSGFLKQKEPVIFKGTNQCPYLARTTSQWLPFLNGERHESARQLIESALDRFDFKRILNEVIGRFISEHMKGQKLNATTLGVTVPTMLFNAMYGGNWDTPEGVALLQRVSHSLTLAEDVFVSIGTYRSVNTDMEWLFDTVSRDMEADPGNHPLLAYLLEENDAQGLGFSKDEMTSMVGIILFGSVETSQGSIAAIAHELLKDRRMIDHILAADEVMVNVLAEEFFRFISAQQYTIRICKKDLNLDGKVIPAGSRIYLSLAAANRDPSIFPDPDRVVLDRRNNPHLAFGAGVHACAGSRLVRMELRLLLKPLAAALQSYELDEAQSPKWHKTIFIRGLKELMIIRR